MKIFLFLFIDLIQFISLSLNDYINFKNSFLNILKYDISNSNKEEILRVLNQT